MIAARLVRIAHFEDCTLGRLTILGHTFYTVERPWLGNKPFESCIPEGVYTVKRYKSEKYPDHYEILNVPERSKILIHEANFAKDVQGCIGIGLSLMEHQRGVKNSRFAMDEFRGIAPQYHHFLLEITHFTPEYP